MPDKNKKSKRVDSRVRSVIGYCRCNALNSKVEIIDKKIVNGCVKGKRESCIEHERESYVLGP